MNPYLKGIHLILDSWIPYIDKQGWQLQGEEVKMAKLYVKWGGVEEVNKPNMVIGVPRFRGYLLAIGGFTKETVPLRRQLTLQRQALAYLMGDASWVGFVSVLWGQGIMIF